MRRHLRRKKTRPATSENQHANDPNQLLMHARLVNSTQRQRRKKKKRTSGMEEVQPTRKLTMMTMREVEATARVAWRRVGVLTARTHWVADT
jgi:hypothetical protein